MSNPFESDPTPSDPYTSPQHGGSVPMPATGEGDLTGGIIPYKNMPALLAYYLGLFSLFPCLGIVLAIPAFILGIIGLQMRRKNPVIKGSVHAWIGIVMGGLFTIVWGAVIVLMIFSLIASGRVSTR